MTLTLVKCEIKNCKWNNKGFCIRSVIHVSQDGCEDFEMEV